MRQPVVLAHAGGVPEALTLGVAVLIVVGFMLLELRARRRERAAAPEENEEPT